MSNAIKIIAIASLANVSATQLAADAATDFETGKIAYLNGAKRLAKLTELVGHEKAAAAMRKVGVSEHTIKNARQLVRVYEAVVATGLASEEWFNGVLYMDAVAINRGLAKLPAEKLAYAFKGSVKSAAAECELVAETGMTKVERIEAAEKAAAAPTTETPVEEVKVTAPPSTPAPVPAEGAKTEAAKTETPKTEGKPPAEVVSPAPAPEAAAKPPASPMAEFDVAADKVEALAVAILAKSADEVTIDRIRERMVAVCRAVESAIAAKTKAKGTVKKAA